MQSDSLVTGQTLLLLLADPNHQNWDRFVLRYGPRIYRWLTLTDLQEADQADVYSEIFVKLVKHLPAFSYEKNKGLFRSWLKTLAKNAVFDMYKNNKRYGHLQARMDDALDRAWRQSGVEKLLDEDLVYWAMQKLPEDQASVLRLRYVKDFTYEEIAKELGISAETARKRAERGRENLRVVLEESHGE